MRRRGPLVDSRSIRKYAKRSGFPQLLTVDVPGVLAKDLQVQVDDNVLRITGERKTAGSESKFIRSFAIDPKTVDVENIKANLDCGVLTLTAPKQIKPAVSKTIAVTAAPSAITQTSVTSNKSE